MGGSKVVTISKYGTAEEYMMRTDDVASIGSKEFKAKEGGNASNTNKNGNIEAFGSVYPLHRQYKTLENPMVI